MEKVTKRIQDNSVSELIDKSAQLVQVLELSYYADNKHKPHTFRVATLHFQLLSNELVNRFKYSSI